MTDTTCQWYAACENDAAGTVDHPILGKVPTCHRCADKHGATLDLFPMVGDITDRTVRHITSPERHYHVRHYNESSDTWTLESLGGKHKGEASAVHVTPAAYEALGENGWEPLPLA